MMKRLMPILMALCMVVAFMPFQTAPALAIDAWNAASATLQADSVAKVRLENSEERYFKYLGNALAVLNLDNASMEGAVVTVLKDIDEAGTAVSYNGTAHSVTLNLGGKTVNFGTINYITGSNKTFTVEGPGTLNIGFFYVDHHNLTFKNCNVNVLHGLANQASGEAQTLLLQGAEVSAESTPPFLPLVWDAKYIKLKKLGTKVSVLDVKDGAIRACGVDGEDTIEIDPGCEIRNIHGLHCITLNLEHVGLSAGDNLPANCTLFNETGEGYEFYQYNPSTNMHTKLEKGKLVGTGNSVMVTFDLNGGTDPLVISPQIVSLNGGRAVKPDNPTKDAARFKGWYDNADCVSGFFNFALPVTHDVTLYAGWVEDPGKAIVKYDAGDGAGDMEPQVVPAGQNVTLKNSTFIPPAGLKFKNWQIEGEDFNPGDVYRALNDLTVYAVYVQKPGGGGKSKVSSGDADAAVYNISLEDTANGVIKASERSAKAGALITLKITPDLGYDLDKLTVTYKEKDQDGNKKDKEVKVSYKDSEGLYLFNMPAASVVVKAAFKSQGGDTEFKDVNPKSWYAKAVAWAVKHGMMQGVGDGFFKPDDFTTRAHLARLIYNAEGMPATSYQIKFLDVKSNAWYADAVKYVCEKGIMDGYDQTHFAPNEYVTREQLATILYRYGKVKGADLTFDKERKMLAAYPDAGSVASWAKDAMEWALEKGILKGMETGNLAPKGNATRGQVATILQRIGGMLGVD